MKKIKKNIKWEQVMNIFKRNPVQGVEIVVSMLNSKNDMLKLEAAIFILDHMYKRRKNST